MFKVKSKLAAGIYLLCIILLTLVFLPLHQTSAQYQDVYISKPYPVTIPPHATITQLVKAGNYDSWSDSTITDKHFPIPDTNREVKINLFLVHYHDYDSRFSPNGLKRTSGKTIMPIVKDLKSRGFRPAKIAEILAFGSQHPDIRPRFIIALGSSWSDSSNCHQVLVIGKVNNRNSLYLHEFGGIWECRYNSLFTFLVAPIKKE